MSADIKPYGWLTGESSSHRQGNLEDFTSSHEWAKEICDEHNKWTRADTDCDPDHVDRVPEPLYSEKQMQSVLRENLELTRVNAERGLQIERLDVALTRSKAATIAPAQASQDERADFEAKINATRFFPSNLDFTRIKSPSGRDEYKNSHLQSNWNGWQLRGQLAAQSAPQQAACIWTPHSDHHETGGWDSACGEIWIFIDGGPTENSVRFCQGCGKPVSVVAPAADKPAS